MQQICHQIRAADAGGDLNFSEISEVVPWLELAVDQGQNLEECQYGESDGKPRLFKTHAWEEHCPKFPKTIVVLRNPFDVLLSFYRFFEDWFFEKGALSLDAFANEFWLARDVPASRMENASYFVHLLSWYKRRNDPTVLFVFFEDLKENLQDEVGRIARFMSNEKFQLDTPETIQLVTERSCFDYMKRHAYYFDEKLSKLARNEACGLSKDAGLSQSKLVNGKVGEGKELLSEPLKVKIQEKWSSVVEPVTGCASYEDLKVQLQSIIL